jgi:hypothetical protein
VAEAGGRPILVGADVTDEQDVDRMFDRSRRMVEDHIPMRRAGASVP